MILRAAAWQCLDVHSFPSPFLPFWSKRKNIYVACLSEIVFSWLQILLSLWHLGTQLKRVCINICIYSLQRLYTLHFTFIFASLYIYVCNLSCQMFLLFILFSNRALCVPSHKVHNSANFQVRNFVVQTWVQFNFHISERSKLLSYNCCKKRDEGEAHAIIRKRKVVCIWLF